MRQRSRLRHCATNMKITGSIPYVVTVIGIFDVILPAANMALGSTQPLTEMSKR
jgi:hypothetical protein